MIKNSKTCPVVATAVLALVLCVSLPAFGSVWASLPPLAEARQEVAVAAINDRVYVIGGFRSDLSIANTVEVYEADLNSWQFAAPIPTLIHHTTAVALNDKLYVFGGWSNFFGTPLDTVYEYDPNLNSWSLKAPMPTQRASVAATAFNGKIYVAGGSPGLRENDFAVYDVAEDEWTTLTDMPSSRNHLAAGAINGKLYFVGGRSASNSPESNTPTLEAFDPQTGLWSTKTPMPTARSGIAAAVVCEQLFVFGGEGNDNDPNGIFDQVEGYDPVTDSWLTYEAMPVPRHGIGAAVVEGRIHIPGGGPVEGFGVTNTHDVFAPGALIGDFDGNCTVNGSDFLAWQRGESPNPLSSSDLAIWEANFGQGGAPQTSDAASVPEPATVALMISLAAATCLRRGRWA